jgi:hypothetical protein
MSYSNDLDGHQQVHIDVYHPFVSGDHQSTCAALCTNYDEHDELAGCQISHACWCPDGAVSFEAFRIKHPDVTVAESNDG